MASSFPGMDPYLEAPDIWPDFQRAFAVEIRGILNHTLPFPYFACLGNRRAIEEQINNDPIRHSFVEIRDPSRGHQLVTLIEIASPSNKQPGPDRQAYLRKQREVLESDASLIELDLLRDGQRLFAFPELETAVANLEQYPHYLALVNRAWARQVGDLAFQVFPISVTEALPCIPVPLREGQDEVALDLQFAFCHVYDSGPYRRGAVDYTVPPSPGLPNELESWLKDCLKSIE